jgi:hypothetical protein
MERMVQRCLVIAFGRNAGEAGQKGQIGHFDGIGVPDKGVQVLGEQQGPRE